MKHILNDLSSYEKNRILEQYGSQKLVDVKNFKRLAESQLGNVKPLLNEREEHHRDYREKANVNGIHISVGFDPFYGDYTIYFPQIEFGADEDVSDQVLRISENPDEARSFFEMAKNLADEGRDVYEIFKILERERNKKLFGDNF